jgi:hypothetical protein
MTFLLRCMFNPSALGDQYLNFSIYATKKKYYHLNNVWFPSLFLFILLVKVKILDYNFNNLK